MINVNYLQAKIDQGKESRAALRRLRGENVDISEEATVIQVTLGPF